MLYGDKTGDSNLDSASEFVNCVKWTRNMGKMC